MCICSRDVILYLSLTLKLFEISLKLRKVAALIKTDHPNVGSVYPTNEPRDIDQEELDADFIDDTNQTKTDDVGTKRRQPSQNRQNVIGPDNDTPVDQPKRYNLREKKQAAAPPAQPLAKSDKQRTPQPQTKHNTASKTDKQQAKQNITPKQPKTQKHPTKQNTSKTPDDPNVIPSPRYNLRQRRTRKS